MVKIRVYELAKELGIPSKEMVKTLQGLGLNIKNHMSTLEDSQANWVRKRLNNEVEGNRDTSGRIPGEQLAEGIQKPAIRPEQPQIKPESRPTTPPVHKPAQQVSSITDNNKTPGNKSGQTEKGPVGRDRRPPRGNQQAPSNRRQERFDNAGKQPRQSQNTSIAARESGPNKPFAQQKRQEVKDNKNFVHPQSGSQVHDKGKVNNHKEVKQVPARDQKDNRVTEPAEKDLPFKAKSGKKASPTFRKDYSRPGKKTKHKKKPQEAELKLPDMITIEDTIMVRDLAEKLNKTGAEIVKKLMEMGTMVSINQVIDFDTAEIVASLYEVKVEHVLSEEQKMLEEVIDDEESLVPRPPIVTIMGHVDHGKTSLLDRIRKANVVSGEAGGITQHIGAYQVMVNGNKITFIDTPGHEAFTAMRARGANLTDIVVLVVAADDGVMPQTIEAINHIKAAQVPFLVALNKIDKPEANPDKVMQQLTEYNIVPEQWGGDTIFVPVSAKSGEGIDSLLEMILLIAEVHEISANQNRPAEGVVLESELDKGRGAVATVLVQKGTLNIGDSLVCGINWCKVRSMTDYLGNRVEKAYPSMPVEITGWSDVPEVGSRVQACDEKVAKEISSLRTTEKKIEEQSKNSRVSLDEFFKQIQDAEVKELNLIIKGDVQGSVEALSQSLLRLSTDEVKVNVIHSAVGAITETDVMLASASNAIIIGFNIRPDSKARKNAEEENIDVRLYRVIYEAIDDVKKAMVGLLEPEYKEQYMGRAEVRAIFKVPNVGTIGGSYVIDGKIQRNANVRVLRDGVIVYEGKLSSLKRFKDDVKEVVENYECGIGIEDFNDIKQGDIIEAFVMEEIPRHL
ncbi:MAG: translation initiation factor IF-2 [Syntrophomonadaceae bacterium]|jgi:translation initiation factor IF-2